jgi:hypothetical protein
MDIPSSSMRELAQQLLTLEAASPSASHSQAHAAVRVCEKLRVSLTRFVGADGFASLMRRSLALARTEVPSLQNVNINPDGALGGLEELANRASHEGSDAAIAIARHLLTLLSTFVGEPMTLRLVREAWPSLDE